ncbi:SCO4225 family membrane protein [Streptomyces sp. UH6]|uniref:SCO4225 family membrane protein n=1 Tax=Streptomyces sp. UH6 TaxID=2748379 RepID=UPI0015D50FE8|nr:hypothetical protein [Streptomyces sp. UH6]NYV76947.1 hypothetical protein [Streptomyces sp. UH6]
MTVGHILRTLGRMTFGNLASRIYLGVVAGSVLALEVAVHGFGNGDYGFGLVYPMLLTSPAFFLVAPLFPWTDAAWAPYLTIALAALLQSLAIGALVRLVRRLSSSGPGQVVG